MHRLSLLFSLFAVVLLLLPAKPLHAWDDGGHLLVGEIASRRLRPDVAARVTTLTALLDSRFNANNAYNVVTAGTWMDDMRKMPGYPWAAWHYINVPCRGSADSKLPEPPPPHVLWAIKQARAALRSPATDSNAQAVALGQLIHLIGDVHQPLHASDRGDRGGNGFLIAPLGSSDHGPKNLHAFWDAAYRYDEIDGRICKLWDNPAVGDRPPGASVPGVIAEQATKLLAKYPPEQLAASIVDSAQPLAPRHWALESHQAGCASGWPPGPHPTDYEVGRLTPQFVHAAHEIAEQRIVLAGCRLAAVLNAILAPQR